MDPSCVLRMYESHKRRGGQFPESFAGSWLRVDKAEIAADGLDTAQVCVEFPSRANLDVRLVITHGSLVMEESLMMDAAGKGELEVVSSTPGEILVTVKDKPVRVSLMVKEVG